MYARTAAESTTSPQASFESTGNQRSRAELTTPASSGCPFCTAAARCASTRASFLAGVFTGPSSNAASLAATGTSIAAASAAPATHSVRRVVIQPARDSPIGASSFSQSPLPSSTARSLAVCARTSGATGVSGEAVQRPCGSAQSRIESANGPSTFASCSAPPG